MNIIQTLAQSHVKRAKAWHDHQWPLLAGEADALDVLVYTLIHAVVPLVLAFAWFCFFMVCLEQGVWWAALYVTVTIVVWKFVRAVARAL